MGLVAFGGADDAERFCTVEGLKVTMARSVAGIRRKAVDSSTKTEKSCLASDLVKRGETSAPLPAASRCP